MLSPSDFIENAKKIFSNFSITDAIDIALLTVIFALLLSFFRNRKAGALIVGVVFLLVVYGASFIFNLNGVKFILSGVFQIGALALVIIFQPEIRDMLEKVGYGSLKGIRGIGDQSKKKQTRGNQRKPFQKANGRKNQCESRQDRTACQQSQAQPFLLHFQKLAKHFPSLLLTMFCRSKTKFPFCPKQSFFPQDKTAHFPCRCGRSTADRHTAPDIYILSAFPRG